MKVLVTGAKGFVGKNLCWALKNIQAGKDKRFPNLNIDEVFEYDIDTEPQVSPKGGDLEGAHPVLDAWCRDCDFVFNLAGVNRPQNQEEFMQGNFGFASTLLDTLKKYGNRCPVMLSSSQQASLTGRFGNSEYGRSKRAGEDLFLEYEREFLQQPPTNSPLRGENENPPLRGGKGGAPRVLIYRFPNLFGKWCRPNYNSAVATFCNAFASDLPYTVNDPSVELELLYIDDLVDEMIACLRGEEHRCEFNGLEVVPTPHAALDAAQSLIPASEPESQEIAGQARNEGVQARNEGTIGRYCYVPTTYKVTLGQIVYLLEQFKANGTTQIPFKEITLPHEGGVGGGLVIFAKKLYSTYLSYLPKEKVAFPLKMNVDDRGSFTELVHTLNCGQVSINISKPGITKGQHWHNTKWEQFIVVKGHGLIQQRGISPTQPSPQGRATTLPLEGGAGGGLWNTADPALYEKLKENAEKMRKNPTEAESVMWKMLRGKNLDAKFRRQHIIGDYIVDFVCLDKQLVIELDGGYHNDPEQQKLDRQRTNFLQSKGFSVLRFTNEEVLLNTEETISIIKNVFRYLTPSPEERAGERLVLNWFVSGNQIEAVHMLPGYTHNIINLSDKEDLVTVMYCNEIFNPNKPDTFFEIV